MATIGVVLGRFHKAEADEMLDEVRRLARDQGHAIGAEVWVPGSMEKPLALKRLLRRPDIDGAVVLGIIERGETRHGLVMGMAVVKTVIDLQLEFMKPVGIGILGPEILPSQIPSRVRPYARAAIEALDEMLKG